MEEYEVSSVVRGFHVYQRSWSPSLEEQLECLREAGNDKDRYAVAVLSGTEALLATFQEEFRLPVRCSSKGMEDINIGGFQFGDLVLNRQIAKLNVSPIFLRLRYAAWQCMHTIVYNVCTYTLNT